MNTARHDLLKHTESRHTSQPAEEGALLPNIKLIECADSTVLSSRD